MTTKSIKQRLISALIWSAVVAACTVAAIAQEDQNASKLPATATTPSSTVQTVVHETADQLDAMVAPIALYPDALVAQVLAAAAYPEQIAFADDWLTQNNKLTFSALTQAVDEQDWDPSVKALSQFPSVLRNMAHNLSWTSSLGDAFTNQQSDVMAAVQTMRAKAQAAGTLKSNSQLTVVQQSPSTIVITPANPQVVYIPQYNPAVIYGAPVVVPFYVPPPVPIVTAGVYFGSGIAIGAVFGGGWGGFGWGWHAWNVSWGGGWGGGGSTIIYNNNTYINKRTWNNTYINNRTSNTANNNYHPGGPNDAGYHPGTDTHYGPNGGYHPNGYYGPNGGFHHDVPGTNPNRLPNGGDNGNHGLIGGDGGVQRPAADYGDHSLGTRDNQNASLGAAHQSNSFNGGDGERNRAGSARERNNMHPTAMHTRQQRMRAPRMNTGHFHGGGHRH
jgi:hypothetical protein